MREQLHAKIEMVESIYDEEHHRFSEELGKQAAQLAPRIQVLNIVNARAPISASRPTAVFTKIAFSHRPITA